jgi:hypothetical protein
VKLVRQIVQQFLHHEVPPAPAPEKPMPTPEDLRWARAEAQMLIRRARTLGVDVDLERTGR